MPKLRVYIAEQKEDHDCYNLMAKTKTGLINSMEACDHMTFTRAAYAELSYSDAFDLMWLLTGEGCGRNLSFPFEIIREYKKPLTANHVPEEV